MLEGVDRLIDLAGLCTSGLTGASPADVVPAVMRCDVRALGATDGHFAVTARDGKTVRLARTLGLPLRYFVAKMYHGPILVVAERMDQIFAWCQEQRIAWQFDPAYTRMVPAHHLVELDQVGCPDPSPRYRRFFDPAVGLGSADIAEAGAAYIGAAYESVKRWLAAVPAHQPIAVAFSGGLDSTAVLLLARRASEDLGRSPEQVRAFTLDLGGGRDAEQAEHAARELGLSAGWERIDAPPDDYDLEGAIRLIEDYHPLDVECAASSVCLLRGIRERYPTLTYLLDGDGGDENLKSYPLEDSDLTLSSVLRNPLLYQEGWGIDAIKHSLAYSGGLSRSYVRTYAPAAAFGFDAFSPFTTRSVIASAVAIPFEQLLDGREERLTTLKRDVVSAGIRAVLGIDMPINQKRRFQDGAAATPRERASKAWCRRTFNRVWQERQREADAMPVGG
ncbi:MAG TPA: asparagine synthase C-terminal domain-containing protein [Vicinamibacterales bacterium]|nr:asparagine synthase C-terminal domain-containing protein [Vicinamibacterales bacterium]